MGAPAARAHGDRRRREPGATRPWPGGSSGWPTASASTGSNGEAFSCQLPNWNEFVLILLAARRLGAIVNPIPPTYRASEVRFMLGLLESQVMVIPAAFRGFDHAAMLGALRPEVPRLEHVFVARGGDPGGLTRSLAAEWARHGIQVNCLAPGYMNTDILRAALADETTRARFLSKIPARRIGEPEEAGTLAVYLASSASDFMTGQTLYLLASDAAGFITGQTLSVSGGYTMM